MFASIWLSVLLVVSPVLATITLPNGFTIDETQYVDVTAKANYKLDKCTNGWENECSDDCSAQLYCDGTTHTISDVYPCFNGGYCIKNASSQDTCTGNFPMTNQACLSRAINNFVCTEDGQFPDPTDCNKYHVCNGAAHYIEECLAYHQFLPTGLSFEDPYTYPGSGEFSCRFSSHESSCTCNPFYCDGMPNKFTFRIFDYFNYAYCLQVGTSKKVVMFKCPKGTRHTGQVSTTTNSVECIPISAQG